MNDPIVGVDLGTSNSVVAVAGDDGEPRILADSRGQIIQPSVVSFLPSGAVVVGSRAKQRRVIDPRNTVYSAKRLLGRTFDSREVSLAASRLPFTIKRGVNQQPVVLTRAGELSVPEITAIVLDHMRSLAQSSLGVEVHRAVVAVPANFTDAQRTATVTAGQIAGLEVVQVINEPTAAAIAYGHTHSLDRTVAVYDFGGGTFDITILRVSNSVYEVLATAGDPFLGGDDIDERLVEILLQRFQNERGIDLRGDQQALQRLRSVAEQIKVELSRRPRAMAKIDQITTDRQGAAVNFSVRITRDELERYALPVVDQSFEVCRQALTMAGLSDGQVDDVILVGGTSKMPLVRSRVSAFFGRPARVDVNPDEAVALGAALQGYALRQQLGAPDRRNTARGAVVPPAPPMEARAGADKREHDDWARGTTMPRVASWDRTDTESNPEPGADDDGSEIDLDTMDIPTTDRPLPPEAGFRRPSRGTVDYIELSDVQAVEAQPRPQPPAADSAGSTQPGGGPPLGAAGAAAPAGGRTLRGPAAVADTMREPIAATPAGASTVRGTGPAPPRPGPASTPQSLTDDPVLALESLGIEDHRSDEPTGARPLDLEGFGPPGPSTPSGRPPRDDSQAHIATNVANRTLAAQGGAPAPSPAVTNRALAPPPPDRSGPANAGAPGPSDALEDEQAGFGAIPTILEVTPHSLGISTVAGYCRELVARNARVPAETKEVFTTSKDRQQTVRIQVCQGESRRVEDNVILGDLVLDGLAPRPRGETRIEVTFRIDESGILRVHARDQHSGLEQQASLQLLGLPSAEEVTSATQRLRLLRRDNAAPQ
ncbi:Hsp70 family protein [Haliangium sp.]|uniref:Hsp70 family protein n=1 Tax=Haliangium sp. TaxID=2663208 RepID=UPI003D13A416